MDEIQPLTFNVGETEKIKDTVELYLFVKELLIYNEIIDPESYTFPQVINELRNAYDHFNRILAEKLKIVDEKEDGYSIETLDKALGVSTSNLMVKTKNRRKCCWTMNATDAVIFNLFKLHFSNLPLDLKWIPKINSFYEIGR